MLSNVLPSNCPYLYVYNAENQVVLYTGNDFTDLTGRFETNGGDIWLLTKLNDETIVILTAFHKTQYPTLPLQHCVSSFVYD